MAAASEGAEGEIIAEVILKDETALLCGRRSILDKCPSFKSATCSAVKVGYARECDSCKSQCTETPAKHIRM